MEKKLPHSYCPSTSSCPLFQGLLKNNKVTIEAYKIRYCQVENGNLECKRWQSAQKYGKAPHDLLPNSTKTLEEIGKENGWV